MGMDRPAALAYIQELNLARTEALSGVTTGDTAAGYKSAIDDSGLALDVAFDDLATMEVSSNIRGLRAALTYYALRTNANGLLAKLTTTDIGDTLRQAASKELEQVRGAMQEAATEAAAFGVAVGSTALQAGTSSAGLDTLSFDIYEPTTSEGGVL